MNAGGMIRKGGDTCAGSSKGGVCRLPVLHRLPLLSGLQTREGGMRVRGYQGVIGKGGDACAGS